MGKMQRDKGKVGERELAAFLSAHGFQSSRGVQYHGGKDSPDVICGRLHDLVHFECKRVEHMRLYPALAQAIRDAAAKMPVVAHRMNSKPWVAILRLEDLMSLFEKVYPDAERRSSLGCGTGEPASDLRETRDLGGLEALGDQRGSTPALDPLGEVSGAEIDLAHRGRDRAVEAPAPRRRARTGKRPSRKSQHRYAAKRTVRAKRGHAKSPRVVNASPAEQEG